VQRVWAATWRIAAFLVIWGALLAPLIILPVASSRDNDATTPGWQLYLDTATLAAMLAAAWIAVRYFDRRWFRSLGFEPRAAIRDLPAGLVIGSGMIAVALAITFALGWARIEVVRSALTRPFALVALSVALNTITQELLFRGYILQTIAGRFRVRWAIAVTSVLFTAAHAGALAAGVIPTLNLLLAGFLLAVGYVVTRNLWLPIGLHFAWNFLQGPVLGLAVSGEQIHGGVAPLRTMLGGPEVLSGGMFGFEGGLVGTAVTLAGVAVLYLVWTALSRPTTVR
jgi:membrane protease YdiL (CAAX protease family)